MSFVSQCAWKCNGCRYLKNGWYCTLHDKSIGEIKDCNKYEGKHD